MGKQKKHTAPALDWKARNEWPPSSEARPDNTKGVWYELIEYRQDKNDAGVGYFTLIIWQDKKKLAKHNYKRRETAKQFAQSQYDHLLFKAAKQEG